MTRAVLAICILLGTAMAVPVDPPLQCSLGLGADGRVKITVRNVSSGVIKGDIYPAFILEPTSKNSESNRNFGSFWAPVDLDTGRTYGANKPRRITLRPQQVLEVEVAPNKLLWDLRISSRWPNHLIENIAPSGLYSLYLALGVPGSNEECLSNRQPVAVDKNVMRLLPEHP
jgi:hypothetical protein